MNQIRKFERIPTMNNATNQPADIKKVQAFNNGQIYTMGFLMACNAGAANTFNPTIGGKARHLHGITIIYPLAGINDDDIINLTINSENLITNVNQRNYNPQINTFKTDQFYAIPRALSGNDSVEVKINAVTGRQVYMTFYLSSE